MSFLELLRTRREVTRFAPDPLPAEYVRGLAEAAYLSVTGNNLPSREFVFVFDAPARQALSRATPYMGWLADAPLGVVVAGAPAVSKYWLQDATIAASNVWLAAVELGLGAAWGAIHHAEDPDECRRREQAVRGAVGIPPELRPVAVLGIGFPAAPPAPKEMYPLSRVLHMGRYGQRVETFAAL